MVEGPLVGGFVLLIVRDLPFDLVALSPATAPLEGADGDKGKNQRGGEEKDLIPATLVGDQREHPPTITVRDRAPVGPDLA